MTNESTRATTAPDLHKARLLMQELNSAALSLAADLVSGADYTFQGKDYLERNWVVDRVMEWRAAFGATAKARNELFTLFRPEGGNTKPSSVPSPSTGGEPATDSTGRDSMLREAAQFLLDRYDEMREKKGAPSAIEFELLREGLSREPAPVARELSPESKIWADTDSNLVCSVRGAGAASDLYQDGVHLNGAGSASLVEVVDAECQKVAGEERDWETRLLAALAPILEAVQVNDSDTMGILFDNDYVIWTASGSWSALSSITLGDLRKIAELATWGEGGKPSIEEFRAFVASQATAKSAPSSKPPP